MPLKRERTVDPAGPSASGLGGTVTKLAYRIPEVVEATGLSRSVLYEDMAAGRLAFVKRGRSRLVLADDLARYLDSLSSQPLPAA